MTQVWFVLLWTEAGSRYSVQLSSASSVEYQRCRPTAGLSEGLVGAELIVMALAPASAGGGTKEGGSASPPPLLPRMGVRGIRFQCTKSWLTVCPHWLQPDWPGSCDWKYMW